MKTREQIHTITLTDGRRLSYYEYGDPAGKPLFYFSGGTASGQIGRMLDSSASRSGVRMLAPNRPGIGQSDFKPGRSLRDWPEDLCQLAYSLGLDRFAVLSESGGSPYVAACAREIPERLSAAVIVSGTSPFDVPEALQGMSPQNRASVQMMKFPLWMLRLAFLPMVLTMRRDPERLRPQLLKLAQGMPEPDRVVFTQPETLQAILDAYCEAFQQGTLGPALDIKLCAQGWGVWLPEITMDVQLWHGEEDTNTPISMARYMQQAIPRCRATFIPGEGHVSLMHNHGQEIFASI